MIEMMNFRQLDNMFRMIKERRESHTVGREVQENPSSQKFVPFCFLKLPETTLTL